MADAESHLLEENGPGMNEFPQNAIAVGIDLGTTYSVVAQVDEYGQPQIIPNQDNQRTTPSVVYLDGQNAIVGKIAKDQSQFLADNTVQFIKPHIGRRRKRFQIGEMEWSAEEISAMILRKLVLDAETMLGPDKAITHAVITVPAFFTEQQRKSTEDAGQIAGLEVLSVINEPTAAALAYGFNVLGLEKTVVVYDLGGGTFDVTIMRITGDNITMLATDGDVQLGGKDWDERIIEYVAELFKERHGIDPREDAEGLQSLYGQAEQAKLRLSRLPKTRVNVVCRGISDNFELMREQFEEMTEDLLDQTETTLRLTVNEAGLQFNDIDEVLLVGGSTRMRSVQNMIHRLVGRPPRHLINPDECVALGAAIQAVVVQLKLIEEGHRVPVPHVREEQLDRFRKMQEQLINPHTLGIKALDRAGAECVVPIIPRRAHIPSRAVKTFKTSIDDQNQVRIVIMEGESAHPEACSLLGECLVRGLPKGIKRGTPIEVCFECNDGGQLGVTARLPTIQQSVKATISRTVGLSEEKISEARKRVETLRIE